MSGGRKTGLSEPRKMVLPIDRAIKRTVIIPPLIINHLYRMALAFSGTKKAPLLRSFINFIASGLVILSVRLSIVFFQINETIYPVPLKSLDLGHFFGSRGKKDFSIG